jgi:hypothetical protein
VVTVYSPARRCRQPGVGGGETAHKSAGTLFAALPHKNRAAVFQQRHAGIFLIVGSLDIHLLIRPGKICGQVPCRPTACALMPQPLPSVMLSCQTTKPPPESPPRPGQPDRPATNQRSRIPFRSSCNNWSGQKRRREFQGTNPPAKANGGPAGEQQRHKRFLSDLNATGRFVQKKLFAKTRRRR